MQDSKLIRLIRSLSPEEIRWLAKFVRSPYYNSNEEVIALFDYIRKYYPACQSSRLNKTTIFEKLLPKETFSDRRIRLLMFRLSNVVEEFLVNQGLKKDTFQYQKYLLAELRERNFYEQFEKKSKALRQQLETQSFRDEPYYEAQWHLQKELLFHPKAPRYQITKAELDEAIRQLDIFYLMAKLRYSGELLNRQNILSEQYDIVLLKELRQLVSEHPDFKENIALQVYNDVLFLMEHHLDEPTFVRLEKNFRAHLHLFRKLDQAALLRYLINCTIQLHNNGKIEYINHQIQLYQFGLEKGLFLEEERLPDSTFLNIVVTGTVQGAVSWVEDVITQYASSVGASASNLAKAYWYFAKKDFAQSNELLLKIEESDLAYNLRIKSLSLRNHHEMFLQDHSYYELFLHESNAFEKFIRRNDQITTNRADSYLNFISFLRKLSRLRFQNRVIDPKWIKRLQGELNQTATIIARRWLIEKVVE